MPNRMNSMSTVVGVDMFVTGRMELRLKTGLRASSREGVSGLEQFSMMPLHGAAEDRRTVPLKQTFNWLQQPAAV